MWVLLLTLWANEPNEKVLKCHDEIIDTGERTKEGKKILKLIRTHCHWVPIYLPPHDVEED